MKQPSLANVPVVPHVTDTEWAWLAGIAEGEGHFRLKGNTPIVELEMTDRDVVERAALIVPGGKTTVRCRTRMGRNGNPNKPSYRYCWYGIRANEVMHGILSYMGKRRKQRIGEILATQLLERKES